MHTTTCCPAYRLPLHRPWWVRAWAGLVDRWSRPAARVAAPGAHEALPLDARLRCDIGLCEGRPSPQAQGWRQASPDHARW